MAYFRVLSGQLAQIYSLLDKDESWCILINADPDAIASAAALARLIRKRVKRVTIARVNDISRPDNLAMIRYLRIPVVKWRPSLRRKIQRYAIVDSQEHHHPGFAGVEFSLVIDHHPLPETPTTAAFQEIRPDYGSVSTMMTEYLYSAGVRPGRLLATALQYGIRTDTGLFGRNCTEVDLRAYHYLSRFGDTALMMRILRSEYLPHWLPYFASAFETLKPCGRGSFAWLGKVESGDILVVVADFFLKVHGLRWVAVCGVSGGRVIAVFRGGYGNMDLGSVAGALFSGLGGGGGHKNMARAEMALADVPKDVLPEGKKASKEQRSAALEAFVFQRLAAAQKSPAFKSAAKKGGKEPAPETEEKTAAQKAVQTDAAPETAVATPSD